MWTRLVLLLSAALFAGCTAAPQVRPKPAQPVVAPSAFKEADPRAQALASAEIQERGAWWRAFEDPVLDGLIAKADLDNAALAQAAARLEQARSLVRASQASRSPQVGLSASVTQQSGPLINAAGSNGRLINTSLNASYEPDFFGRLAQTVQATTLDAQAREALLQSTRLLIHADLAQAYFSIRSLDAERDILRVALSAQKDILELSRRRVRAGLADELEVERALTAVASVEYDLAGVERQRALVEHALSVLVAEPASTFKLEERAWNSALPMIPPGLPSTLLARRPDVSAAQQSLLAAQARFGVAQSAWLPNLSLNAGGGFASPNLGDLFKMSMQQWVLGGLLSLQMFDGGRREAGLKGAAAEVELQMAGYREQVLGAFKDVEDQLVSLRVLADQADIQKRAVVSSARATEMSESRYRNGLISQLDVLTSRHSQLVNRRKALQVRASQYQVTVALVKALGGSW